MRRGTRQINFSSLGLRRKGQTARVTKKNFHLPADGVSFQTMACRGCPRGRTSRDLATIDRVNVDRRAARRGPGGFDPLPSEWGAMAKNRQGRNSACRRACGVATLLLAALAGCGDVRAETIPRLDEVTAHAPDEMRDRAAVSRVTTPARARQESSLAGNPLWGIALTSLQETRARPLFSPSRRPRSPPVIAAPPPPSPKAPAPREPDRLKLTLVGTVIGTSERIGVFVDETSKEVIRMRTGASHDGWTLHSIDRRAASFEKNRQETTLMFAPSGSERPTPSVGVVASGGGGNISGSSRGAANLADTVARPVALTFPASPPPAPGQKTRREIRQDILSIGVQN